MGQHRETEMNDDSPVFIELRYPKTVDIIPTIQGQSREDHHFVYAWYTKEQLLACLEQANIVKEALNESAPHRDV